MPNRWAGTKRALVRAAPRGRAEPVKLAGRSPRQPRPVLRVLSAGVRGVGAAALALLLMAGPGARPAGAQLYSLTDLGTTNMYPEGQGINDLGQFVWTRGVVLEPDHAFLYDGSAMRELTTPDRMEVVPGYVTDLTGDTVACGINRSGQVVGFRNQSGNAAPRAILWDSAGVHCLNPLLGDSYSIARAINDAGQVVGYGLFPGPLRFHAFLYDGTAVHDLGTLAGHTDSRAYGINAAGQAVGQSGLHLQYGSDATGNAFLYDGTGMHDLGTLGGTNSIAYGINAAGQVVGSSTIAGDASEHAFLYDGTGMHDLGIGCAYSISATGQAVGRGPNGAVLWENGTAKELISLLPAGSSWRLFTAYAINSRGQILAQGSIGGQAPGHAVLLTPTPAPLASLSPGSVEFGSQLVGAAGAAQTIRITNTGQLPLAVDSVDLEGANPGDYRISADSGQTTLAPGATRTLSLTFAPTSTGSRRATLSIHHNDTSAGSPQSITLFGTGTAPAVSISGSTDFGRQIVGATSAAQTFTITNIGDAPLAIQSVALGGDDAGEFALTRDSGEATLAPQATRSLTLTFAPAAPGSRSALLTVTDSAPGSRHAVTLTGTGLAPTVRLSPTPLNFGSQAVGAGSGAQAIVLQNTGDAPLDIRTVTVNGANAGDFTITADGWTGAHLLPSEVATLNIRFGPAALGSRSASLAISDNAPGGSQTVPLLGDGTAPSVTLSVGSLRFGQQLVGTASGEQIVTLTNTGSAPLTFQGVSFSGANPGDFTATTDAGSALAPGQSRTIRVRFAPTAAGSRAAGLVISDSAPGGPQGVTLAGEGIAPSVQIGIAGLSAPSSVSFGSQPAGTPSAVRTVTLTNTGTAPLAISSIRVEGANAGDFTLTADSGGAALRPNATRTLTLRFTPTALGSRSARLTIRDNAAGSPHSIALSGAGAAAGGGAAPAPKSAELFIVAIDGGAAQAKKATITVGQHVTLRLMVKFKNGTVADLTDDPDSRFSASPARGQFSARNVWAARPEDAGKKITLVGRYSGPTGRLNISAKVSITVRKTTTSRR